MDEQNFICAVDVVTNAVMACVERLEDLGMKDAAAFGMTCGISARLWREMMNSDGEMDRETARTVYNTMMSGGELKVEREA